MAVSCVSYLTGRRIRVTKLDNCGRPVEGDASVVTSKGQVSVAYTANTQEGTEIVVNNSNGENLARVPGIPKFLGYTIAITMGEVDPELFTLLTGQNPVLNYAGDATGFTMDTDISVEDVSFAFELWLGAPAGDACDDEGSEGSFGYLLLPFVQGGIIGDFTVEENSAVTFSINNASTKDGNRWGRGYYAIMRDLAGDPNLLANALAPTEHLLLTETSVGPPLPRCGARPFLPAGDDALTSVAAVDTLLSVEFTPAPGSTDAYWIDFGDGEWDYAATGDPLTHVYEEAGTYTFIAYRGISSFTGEVTVSES